MSTYPVHVDAHLDPHLSRWMWLVKWFLAIPHFVALVFLWLAFWVLSVVALVVILITGRYPRGIFDFNVGVLRWTWRVAYYAWAAFGTDRYPPFSLEERDDYPAHLTIDYPEQLSRGLVLVKWWLLALPHYLVLGLFLGGAYVAYDTAGPGDPTGTSIGLIGLLALVAAVVLLFTGRYPQSVFDLLLGLNRWVLRVAGYAALMTDQYPPFRLDQGGDDPDRHRLAMSTPPSGGTATVAPAAVAVPGSGMPPAPTPPPTASRWTAGRVAAVVIGCVVLMGSVLVGAGGAALAIVDGTQRDGDGYLMSDPIALSTGTYALTSANLEIEGTSSLPHRILGDAKVTAAPTGDAAVFVGVAPTAEVGRYLAGVGLAEVRSLAGNPAYRTRDGAAPSTQPADGDIWVAQAAGAGTQTVTWPVENGDWTVVVMNADGSRGVSADVAAGATVPVLTWVYAGLFVAAGLGVLVGGTILLLAVRRVATGPPSGPGSRQ